MQKALQAFPDSFLSKTDEPFFECPDLFKRSHAVSRQYKMHQQQAKQCADHCAVDELRKIPAKDTRNYSSGRKQNQGKPQINAPLPILHPLKPHLNRAGIIVLRRIGCHLDFNAAPAEIQRKSRASIGPASQKKCRARRIKTSGALGLRVLAL
ncbi:MAG: hypothetical protein AAGU74_06895 [Bacillota bacterium]